MGILAVLLFFPAGFVITFLGLQYNLWMPGTYIAMRLVPDAVADRRLVASFLANGTCFYGIVLVLNALAARFRQAAR